MTLARYTKALVPAVGSILAVLYGWANTGHWDVPTLRLAVVGLVYAFLVYLLPNLPMPTPTIELSSIAEPVRYPPAAMPSRSAAAVPSEAGPMVAAGNTATGPAITYDPPLPG